MGYSELAGEFHRNMSLMKKAKIEDRFQRGTRGEHFILHFLAQSEGDVLPSQISDEMDISSARIAVALNKLEHKGLINRRIDKVDRRRILVELTPEGKDAAEEMERMMIGDIARLLELLGEEDAQEMIRIMSKLANAVINESEGRHKCSKS